MSRDDSDDEREPNDQPLSAAGSGLLAILTTLIDHGVEFIVIGGFAVGYHGYPRATKDVDIVPAPQPENIGKLWEALLELEARPHALGEFRLDELPARFSVAGLLQGGNWDLSTRHGRLDIMQYREGALETPADYQRMRAGAVRSGYGFGTLWIVGFDELIDLKTLAGRDQDLIDVRALREAHDDTAT